MKLYEGEPVFGNDQVADVSALVDAVGARVGRHPLVIGIDGRSGGGKTTLAMTLALTLDAALLSTDDFAWWHSMFDWPQLLIENGVQPLVRGESIDFVPPAWLQRGREGSIRAEAKNVVIVEGVGATQPAMREVLDLCVWVQTDADVARERGLLRDLAQRPDPAEAERFWNTWQSAENEFQAKAKSWAVADFVIRGDA